MPRKHRDIRVSAPSRSGRRHQRISPKPTTKPKPEARNAQTGTEPISPLDEAQRLKKAFQFEHRCKELALTGKPSRYTPNGKFAGTKAWVELAAKLHRQGVDDVIKYVREVFHDLSMLTAPAVPKDSNFVPPSKHALFPVLENGNKNDSQPLTPTTLADPRVIEVNREADRTRQQTTHQRLKFEVEKASREIRIRQLHGQTMRTATYRVLLNPRLEIGPLLRFAIAYSLIREPADSPEQREWNAKFRRVCEHFRLAAYRQFLLAPEVYAQFSLLPAFFAGEAERFYDALTVPIRPKRGRSADTQGQG